jgi:hypothetical protein
LIIGERGGVDHPSGSQVGSEPLKGDASRQARSASEDLDSELRYCGRWAYRSLSHMAKR